MIELFSAMGIATGGLFIAVVLSGLLAGLISYGVIDGYLRARLQRRVVAKAVEDCFKEASAKLDEAPLYLRYKYEPRLEDGGPRPKVGPRRALGKRRDGPNFYWLKLKEAAAESDLIARLLGLPAESLYALHYRQLCGQIASRINAETVRTTGEEKGGAAPLTDVLAVVSHQRDSRPIRFTRPALKGDEAAAPVDILIQVRKVADRAMAEVDLLQIQISEAVGRLSVRLSLVIVILIFSALSVPGIAYLNVASDSSSAILRAIGGITATLVMAGVAILLILAACVISSLTFRVLDRVASAR